MLGSADSLSSASVFWKLSNLTEFIFSCHGPHTNFNVKALYLPGKVSFSIHAYLSFDLHFSMSVDVEDWQQGSSSILQLQTKGATSLEVAYPQACIEAGGPCIKAVHWDSGFSSWFKPGSVFHSNFQSVTWVMMILQQNVVRLTLIGTRAC